MQLRLLELLEVPGVGQYITKTLYVVRTPYRLVKGFINSVDVVKAAHEDGSATASLSRDERIARLAVLKAAANFLGQMSQTREEVRSEHVLVLADKWLAWLEGD